MTKVELINKIRNNRSFDLRASKFYEPFDISDETIKDMADDFYYLLKDVLNYLVGKEEPASEDLEEAGKEWLKPQLNKSYVNYGEGKMMELTHFDGYAMLDAIEFGAKWQKENLWKPADGEDLPEINREVIALLGWGKVVFAHRPPEFWDGKDIVTGKVTRKFPMTYDKGGWNIPDVKYWLDVELPKEIEL